MLLTFGYNIIDASFACIADEGYCDYTPSDSGCNILSKLIVGTGLKVSGTGDCAYRIEADHYIRGTGGTCTGTGSVPEYKFFNKLDFLMRKKTTCKKLFIK